MKDKNIIKWLKNNILNKETIVFFIIAELIFWSPVIVFSIMGLLINPWYWSITTTIIVFWAGPFTPAVPLQIGLTLLLKKMFTKKANK